MAITPIKVIRGHQFWHQSIYDFLLVITTNLLPISHHFQVMADVTFSIATGDHFTL